MSKPARRSNGCAGGIVGVEKRAEKSVKESEAERKTLVKERERREERVSEIQIWDVNSCESEN